jgi:hypothetical protein
MNCIVRDGHYIDHIVPEVGDIQHAARLIKRYVGGCASDGYYRAEDGRVSRQGQG